MSHCSLLLFFILVSMSIIIRQSTGNDNMVVLFHSPVY